MNRNLLQEISKFQKRTYRIIFILLSIISLFCLLISLFYQPLGAYPNMKQVVTIISSCFLGVFAVFIFSPPGNLQGELILQSAEEIFRPIVSEAINNARQEAMAANVNYIENLMDYRIIHIMESVYLNSIKILEEVQPSTIKIFMRAEEFDFDESTDEKDKEALEWFTYLNQYVSRIRGRKYSRIIAIYPKTKEEAESNYKWICKMIEQLENQNVTNCEIMVVHRDITVSCVLLDSKVSFFAFLIDKDFTNFMEIRSKGKDILNRGINDWFDQKFDTHNNVHTIFKVGRFNKAVFEKFQKNVLKSLKG